MTYQYDRLDEDRRTLMKLLGVGAIASGFGAGTVSAEGHTLDAEIEGTLESVSGSTATIMGITVDISAAEITSPTSSLAISNLTGDSFPGRSQAGFLDGIATAVGTTSSDGGTITASSLFVEPAENVFVGAVTANDTTDGQSNEDAINNGTFEVQGTSVKTAQDPRLAFDVVTIEGTNFGVDVSSVPVGSLAEAEGYYAGGTLYAHTLQVSEGETTDESVTITRAQCDVDEDDRNELEVRGESSTPDGTIHVYDDGTDDKLGETELVEEDAGTGGFRLRTEIDADPDVVRAELGDTGTSDTAVVEK